MLETFRSFLKWYQGHETDEGDFAREALNDQTFPAINSWSQLEHYLVRRNASKNTLEAAQRIWSAYETRE